MTARIGSLCSGCGGLDLAVAAVLPAHPVWFAEHEPPTAKQPNPPQAAAKVLAHRWPDVPNHGDLTATNWSTVDPIDIVTAGWPCQPWSVAGRRKGANDERAIWPAIATAIRDLRPHLVVLENVPMVIGLGELARVVGDLAAIGYDAVWTCVRASDVGAPHRRERVFIVATDTAVPNPAESGWPVRPGALTRDGNPAIRGGQAQPGGWGGAAAHSPRDRWGEGRPESARQLRGSDATQRCCQAPTYSPSSSDAHKPDSGHRQPLWPQPGTGRGDRKRDAPPGTDELAGSPTVLVEWGAYRPAINRWERTLGRQAPIPTVLGARGGGQLNPVFTETAAAREAQS